MNTSTTNINFSSAYNELYMQDSEFYPNPNFNPYQYEFEKIEIVRLKKVIMELEERIKKLEKQNEEQKIEQSI